MLTIVGIDPGLNGAFAIWRDGGVIRLDDIPRFAKSLNIYAFSKEFTNCKIDFALIEDVHAMPRQGVSSTFTFGRALGAVEGMLAGWGVPISHVRPREWMKHYSLTPHVTALQRAVERFPEWTSSLTRKRDHNRADAILIAGYGVHVYKRLREDV
jgi:crossover junction endodeoxyribonuclease RuvC